MARIIAAAFVVLQIAAGVAGAGMFSGSATLHGRGHLRPFEGDERKTLFGELTLKAEESWSSLYLASAIRFRDDSGVSYRSGLDPADRDPLPSRVSITELKARIGIAPELDLELGRFELGWGKTDGYSPADAFLPRDLTDPFADEKIPVWCARLTGQSGVYRGELVVSPVSTPWRAAKPGTRSFPMALPESAFLETEGSPPEGGFAAFRAQAVAGDWDIGAWVRGGVLPAWTMELTPDFSVRKVRPEREFTRERGVGAEFSRLAGDAVARAEIAALSATSKEVGKSLIIALGFDKPLWDGTLTVTWARDLGKSGGGGDVPLDRALLPLLIAAWTMEPEWGIAKIVWTSGLKHGDGLAKGEVGYDFAQNWRALAGVDIPYGDADGPLGKLKDARRIRFGVKYAW